MIKTFDTNEIVDSSLCYYVMNKKKRQTGVNKANSSLLKMLDNKEKKHN